MSALAAERGTDRAAAPGAALSVLVDTIERLSAARTVEDIASVVRGEARRLTGADGVAVVVRDGDRCHYVDEDAIGPLWKGRKFPMTACISGWAMLNGETAVIPDIYVDQRIPHDAYRPTFVKSLVMTPVRRSDPLAAIGAYWAETRDPTDDEIEALEAMARATAAAFENVALYASLTEAIERRQFLIDELDHRVKNTLASVQAIAQQTLRNTADPQAFANLFDARLQTLSRAHELLTRGVWRAALVDDIVASAMAPFSGLGGEWSVEGELKFEVTAEAAVALQLALHELATNAAKYGALSTPGGKVRIAWGQGMTDDLVNAFSLTWTESDGPPVTTPVRRGLGTRLIKQGLPYAMGGEAVMDYHPSGLRFELIAPLSDRVFLA